MSLKQTTEINRDGQVLPDEIADLRSTLGWHRTEGIYTKLLERHYAHYTVRGGDGSLIAYVSILSDGLADALLVDLMVHPDHQNCGVGTRLVRRAIADLRDDGIQCIQVTFNTNLTPFYAQCGFHIFGGGIIDFKNMEWVG
jgi:GNAT superfamily N-acetyltransferase